MSIITSVYGQGANAAGSNSPVAVAIKPRSGASAGSNNNTFVDSGPNNQSWAPAGSNALAGGLVGMAAFSPFSSPVGYWSLQTSAYNGEGSYLSPIANTAISVADSQDFTWECFAMRSLMATTTSTTLATHSSGNPIFQILADGTVGGLVSYSGQAVNTAAKVNQWFHVAIVRASNVISLYVNGLFINSTSSSSPINFSGGSARIGGANTTNADWVGYISNLRITVGTAVYTSQFKPSKQPLTALANTKLLTFSGPALRDYSESGSLVAFSGIYNNGGCKLTNFNPFESTHSISQTSGGAGSFFNLSTSTSLVGPSASQNAIGTGDFTADGWVFINSAATSNVLFGAWTGTNSTGSWAVTQGASASSAVQFIANYSGASPFTATSNSGVLIPGTWAHIAVVRQSSVLRVYVNGILVIYNTAFTQNVSVAAPSCILGSSAASLGTLGYASNIRFVSGNVLYTGGASSGDIGKSYFIPPTSPTTAVSGTVYLMNFNTANVVDDAGNLPVMTCNGVSVTTTNVPSGFSTAIAFDGAGGTSTNTSRVQVSLPKSVMQFGSGDFTVECWVYMTGITSANTTYFVDMRSTTSNVGPWSFVRSLESSGKLVWYYTNKTEAVRGTTTLQPNTWYHLAYSRASGVGRLFVNGVLDGSGADTNQYPISNGAATAHNATCTIGCNIGWGDRLNGAMTGLRISKFARYIDNFTPPTGY